MLKLDGSLLQVTSHPQSFSVALHSHTELTPFMTLYTSTKIRLSLLRQDSYLAACVCFVTTALYLGLTLQAGNLGLFINASILYNDGRK